MVPAALTTASTVAVVPTPTLGAETVTVGAVVYPEPPEVIVTTVSYTHLTLPTNYSV